MRPYGRRVKAAGVMRPGTAGGNPSAAELQFTDTLVQDGRRRVAASHVSRIGS